MVSKCLIAPVVVLRQSNPGAGPRSPCSPQLLTPRRASPQGSQPIWLLAPGPLPVTWA